MAGVSFVNVNLVYVGHHFTVDVDTDAAYEEIVSVLVELLAQQKLLDPNRKYEVVLRGALRLEKGATVEVIPATGSLKARNLKPA
jgi:hypothetical protein